MRSRLRATGYRLQASARASAVTLVAVALAAAVGAAVALAAVEVKVEYDESFDFPSARTWAWHPEGAGKVITMTSKYDNAEEIQARLEPTILASIEQELGKRGLTQVRTGEPDFYVSYYLLLRIGASSQQMGQFINPAWGLPPIRGATQSGRTYEEGSLAIDLSNAKERRTVWRGVAAAEVNRQRPEDERLKLIRDAIGQTLANYPPKPKRQ